MKNLTTTLLLLTVALSAHAQTHVNEFQLSFTPKYYLNKPNVENDGFKDAYITTKNNFNKEFGLSYYHRFPSGITLTQSINVGWQRHDIYITYHMDNFDPNATIALTGFALRDQYTFSAPYISNKFMVGYSYKVKKGILNGWRVEGRVGVGLKEYRAGQVIDNYYIMKYRDNSTALHYSDVAVVRSNLNYKKKLSLRMDDYSGRNIGIVYLGMTKEFDMALLKSVNMGLEFNWDVFDFNRPDGDFQHNSIIYDDNGQSIFNTDTYKNKNLNIGLRIAVGLWR